MGLIRSCRRRTGGRVRCPEQAAPMSDVAGTLICEAHAQSSFGEAYGRAPSRGRVLDRRSESPTTATSPSENFDGILP